MEEEGISHKILDVNGISMHVAEKGSSDAPAILFIHGFPEFWYSWRHQILSLSAQGYRCIAPDLRGFGNTSAPPSVSSYSVFHIVGDLVGLLDSLSLPQVFVVGHDWGALVAWNLCMFRPDRVKALVNLSVAFMPRDPTVKPIDFFRSSYGDDYYICRFQEEGVAEKEFESIGTKRLFKKILHGKQTGSSSLSKESFSSTSEDLPLPVWLSEKDIDYFANTFEKTGFTGGMNYYRCVNSNWELTAPWTGAQVKVPTKFIVGDLDLTYHHPGAQDYMHKGGFKRDVPLLDEIVVIEGAGHFIQQERAQEISNHIYQYISKF